MNWTNARYFKALQRAEEEAQHRCPECGTLDELAWDAILEKFVCEGCTIMGVNEPTCDSLYEQLLLVKSVAEASRVTAEHRKACIECGGATKKAATRETGASVRRRAA